MTTAVEDKKKEEVPIQEIEDEADSEEEEEEAKGEETAAAEEGEGKHSRGEKKARKAISKLGLKHMPEVTRVQIRKTKAFDLTIAKPDVYRAPGSDTYIVFGEAKMQEANQQAQMAAAAEQFKNLAAAQASAESSSSAAAPAAADDGPVDESGVDAKDIELVMAQVSTTRAQAVAALKKNNNDIVNAIMSLTV